MQITKPTMGWDSWNTFGEHPDEKLILEIADAMVELGYKDVGYEYVNIDDCWSLRERDENVRLVPDPEKFPHGIKYVADYVHSKGLKLGIYSCAGVRTCADYPSSYGYEYIDAKTFAEWEVDHLKYDFCFFPVSGNGKNAYLTMAQALRNCGRDIVFAACNWGVDDSAMWMRSRGAHTWRSTGDIFDRPQSFLDIFKSQCENMENTTAGCYNDMDMMIVGMHGNGHVGLGGCTDEEYATHFAMWSFLGSPLIIGADIRNIDDTSRKILQNKELIAINQDEEARPPFRITNRWGGGYAFVRLLSNGEFAVGMFNTFDNEIKMEISIDDFGIHAGEGRTAVLRDVMSGEEYVGKEHGFVFNIPATGFKVMRGKIAKR